MNVAMVAGTSASRSGVMRSTAWHFTHTRCGGKMSRAARLAAAAGERELPVLAAERGRRRRRLGIGTARRLALDLPAPGEERRVAHRRAAAMRFATGIARRAATASAPVVRQIVTSAPSASETTAIS